jgi:hypothetical protein
VRGATYADDWPVHSAASAIGKLPKGRHHVVIGGEDGRRGSRATSRSRCGCAARTLGAEAEFAQDPAGPLHRRL